MKCIFPARSSLAFDSVAVTFAEILLFPYNFLPTLFQSNTCQSATSQNEWIFSSTDNFKCALPNCQLNVSFPHLSASQFSLFSPPYDPFLNCELSSILFAQKYIYISVMQNSFYFKKRKSKKDQISFIQITTFFIFCLVFKLNGGDVFSSPPIFNFHTSSFSSLSFLDLCCSVLHNVLNLQYI